MIKLSAKGLAKFMTLSAAGQRKVLRDYKYPDEEGAAPSGLLPRSTRHRINPTAMATTRNG